MYLSLPACFAILFILAATYAIRSDDAYETAEIQKLLTERLQGHDTGLVVAVIDGNTISYAAAGQSGTVRPLDEHSLFRIGSVTKGITNLLLALDVQNGHRQLDDPLSRYFPAARPLDKINPTITLRHLATHYSGLPSMPSNFHLADSPNPYSAYRTDDLVQFLSSYQPQSAPGQERQYSNLGVSLLAFALGNGDIATYKAKMLRQIFDPLGMSDTGFQVAPANQDRLVMGHDRYGRPVEPWDHQVLVGSGSIISSAHDLARLVRALLGNATGVLRGAIELQLAPPESASGNGLTLGWFLSKEGVFQHSGGKRGFRSAIAFDPRKNLGIVVLANARLDNRPMELARHLLIGQPLPPVSPPPSLPRILGGETRISQTLSGRYEMADGRVFEIFQTGEKLRVRYPGSFAVLEFEALNSAFRHFFLPTGNDELVFDLSDEEKTLTITLYGDGSQAKTKTDGRRVSMYP